MAQAHSQSAWKRILTAGSLALAAVLLAGGCTKQTRSEAELEGEAAELYKRANLMVSQIGEGKYSYEYLNFHYQQAIKNVDRILTAYPETAYAKQLRRGDLKLGPYTLDQFRDSILVQLGDMKEATESVVNAAIYLHNLPEANRQDSRKALALILETLCRLVRTDEAIIFPTLPEDQMLARQAIVRVVSQYQKQDVAMGFVQAAEPGEVEAIASAYGEGLAIGGLKSDELEEIILQFPSTDGAVARAILRGMAQRESGIYRDSFDKVKQKREEEARRDAERKGIQLQEPEEAPVRYDLAAFYQKHFPANPPADATTAVAAHLALQGRLEEARRLVTGLGAEAQSAVLANYYDHLALNGRLTGKENLHRAPGLAQEVTNAVNLKLVELLAKHARYAEADTLRDAEIAAHPELHDQFVLARFRGRILSREELFYLEAKTIPELNLKDPAICAQALLEWFLSPNRLLKGSSWGADQILFKYFSIQREGRPVSRNFKAKSA